MKEEKYWLLLSKMITGEASAEELAFLHELVEENQEWKAIMENLQELWNSRPSGVNADIAQKNEDAYLVHINRLKEKASDFNENDSHIQGIDNKEILTASKKPLYINWKVYAIAATVIAAMFFIYPLAVKKTSIRDFALAKAVNEITIDPGSKSKILLPDGSQVWINSGSKLTYENSFKGDTREVQLDGEAYFDVVKDAEHPFIVHTSGIDIKVLGTAFNVKAYKVEPVIEATLIHGSIEVINKNRPGAPKIMLKPHEKLVYNKYPVDDSRDQRVDIKPAEPDAYSITVMPLAKNIADSDIVETAWVYNKLAFEDEKLEDLAVKMEKWYDLKITIEDEKLKGSRVSGSFINETAEEALKELQFLLPFRYSIKNKEVKIIRK